MSQNKRREASAPNDVELIGGRLVAFVLAAALVGTWVVRDRDPSVAEAAAIVLGSLSYLVLALCSAPLDARPMWARRGYFVVQLALVATILIAFGRVGAFGTAWLLTMPLVAEATLVLPVLECTAAGLLALGVIEMQAWMLGGWRTVLDTVLPLGLAVAFVVLFARLARKEALARAHSEELRAELAEANRHLADYAEHAEALATERERTRLAGEIHDGLGHMLTVATVQIEAALATLDDRPGDARSALERAAAQTREGLAEVRRAVAALGASPLEGKTLAEALAELAGASTGLDATLDVRGEPRVLPPAAEHTLYRAAQEALTNIHKHAFASSARLLLDYDDAGRVVLVVADDGVGRETGPSEASAEPAEGGFGLWSIERRAERLGGTLTIGPSDSGGTELRVEVPT